MKEVEIIKIGDCIGNISQSIKNSKPYGLSPRRIMVLNEGDEIYNYYLNILKEGIDFESGVIDLVVTFPETPRFGDMASGKIMKGKSIKGKENYPPKVNESYLLDSSWHTSTVDMISSWHTSTVDMIIDDCILITKNSVYAIHDLASFRNKKINDLGIS